ncbi:MAG: hypothetical protein ACLFO1_05445, partial [Spirochaetaceae bacterium]
MSSRSPAGAAIGLIIVFGVFLLILGSCATGETGRDEPARGDGPAEAEREPAALRLEPVTPVDGAPVTEVPVRIDLRAVPRDNGDERELPDRFTLSVFTDPEAPAETAVHQTEVPRLEGIQVPARVLVDGRTYHYRLEAPSGTRSEVFSFRLAVEAPVPEPSTPADGTATFNRTPSLTVAEVPTAVEYEYELRPVGSTSDADG